MQDWSLRYQLASVEGVAEVASIGGFVKQYQVTVDPAKLRAYSLSISEVAAAIKRSNGEVGGRSLELSEQEFILRVKGYLQNLEELRKTVVGMGGKGAPVLLRQIANVEFGPDMRRGSPNSMVKAKRWAALSSFATARMPGKSFWTSRRSSTRR